MLKVKIFGLSDKGADEANKFTETKRLIENGIQIRDNCIVVLYDDADHFDEKSREVSLVSKLAQAEGALLGAEIEKEYYQLVEDGGKMTSEQMPAKQKNLETISGLEAQIYLMKKKLGRDPGEPVLFGKKQYKLKKK